MTFKKPRGLQFVWVWTPIGWGRSEVDPEVLAVWWQWHFYFHRKSMASSLHMIYRWVAQFGPLMIRCWR
jgi:hypothetical protein